MVVCIIAIFLAGDRRELKELEDKIIDEEISPDDIAGLEMVKEEQVIDSTTPEQPRKRTAKWEPLERIDSEEEYHSTPKRPLSSGTAGIVNKIKMMGKNSINVKVACNGE